MPPKLTQFIIECLESVLADSHERRTQDLDFNRQILTHLSRINSTLSAIDRNLTLLETKK